jgi:death-on-curing protein
MRYLTVEEVLRINASEVGPDQLRDRHLLEAAIERPQQSAFGEDAYEDTHLKAAALMHSLIGNHPFIDGNKRTGVLSAYMFYALNGWLLEAADIDLIHLAVDIAVEHFDVPTIAEHLKKWVRPIPDPIEEEEEEA